MGCTEGLARIFVFIANFAFLLVGLALLVVGILFKVNFTKYTQSIPSDYSAIQYVPTIAIIVGAIIFVIAFLGCCGALRSNTCMLSWYGGILIVIFMLQIGLGIFAVVQIKDKSDLETKIANEFRQLVNKYGQSQQARETVDLVQQTFECCGADSPDVWNENPPKSCFDDNDTSRKQFTRGCNTVFPEFISNSIKTIAIVALVISVTEIVGAILSFCLASCIKERRRQGAYY